MGVPARVIVLAGPSGSGKSRLAERLGLPVLRLDDYYRAGDEPGLPLVTEGTNAGMVDWDHPGSWRLADALAGIEELCLHGHTDVPVYSIPLNRSVGTQRFDIGAGTHFVAEGIFAPEVVAHCSERGLLEAAYCVRQHPLVTFWRRLRRDLRERRKAPAVLVRRGLALMRSQREVVQAAVARGCLPAHPDEAYAALAPLVRSSTAER